MNKIKFLYDLAQAMKEVEFAGHAMNMRLAKNGDQLASFEKSGKQHEDGDFEMSWKGEMAGEEKPFTFEGSHRMSEKPHQFHGGRYGRRHGRRHGKGHHHGEGHRHGGGHGHHGHHGEECGKGHGRGHGYGYGHKGMVHGMMHMSKWDRISFALKMLDRLEVTEADQGYKMNLALELKDLPEQVVEMMTWKMAHMKECRSKMKEWDKQEAFADNETEGDEAPSMKGFGRGKGFHKRGHKMIMKSLMDMDELQDLRVNIDVLVGENKQPQQADIQFNVVYKDEEGQEQTLTCTVNGKAL